MHTDVLVAHETDLGEVVGEFYGTPIRTMDTLSAELREIFDTQVRVRAFLGTDSAPLELLPGEVVKDNIIRRFTTAEVIGDKFYTDDIPEGKQVPMTEESLKESGLAYFMRPGMLITWRPNNLDIAVIHEEKETNAILTADAASL
jgi:hypothetical protein